MKNKDHDSVRHLFSVINTGDITALKQAIEDGADVNSTDEDGKLY